MAIYHCSIKVGSRGAGRSACGAAAYRAGDKVEDRETGLTHDFQRKSGVVHDEIMLCKNAPARFMDRETLWNEAQAAERQKDGQLFREVEVALPRELTRDQQIELVRDYCRENFVSQGMCADWALHDKLDGNPHAHIMLTMRGIDQNGRFLPKRRTQYALDENGEKIPILDKNGEQKIGKNGRRMWKRIDKETNDWNSQENAELWRANWAKACNQYLPQDQRIDHRSFQRRGLDRIPMVHEGFAARQHERRGGIAPSCEVNREIRALNEARRIVDAKERELIVKQYRVERDQRIKEYLDMLHGRNKDDGNRENNVSNRGRTAERADERSSAKHPVRRRTKSNTGSVGRNPGRSLEDFGQKNYLPDVPFFDVDSQTQRASLLLPDSQRSSVEVEQTERVRDPNLQFKGADEQRERIQRQIDAIRRRKRAEKLASEKSSIKNQSARIATTGSQINTIKNKRKAEANYKRGVDSVMQAVKTGAAIPDKVISAMLPDDIKQVYSAAKKMLTMPLNPKNLLPHNMIKNAFEVIGQCAKAGDNGAQAFLQNHGAIGDNVKARWDLMSVMEQDELKSKFVYADDWGFEEKSPMEALNRRGPVNPIPSGREQNKERVRVLTFGH